MEKYFGLAALILLAACAAPPQPVVCDVPFATFGGECIELELAKTFDQKVTGLMHRESMPLNHGMLFFFEKEMPLKFWMKDTLIPLDMIFLDKDFRVVEVKSNIQPCKADPCPTYPGNPAMYVLEINGGLSQDFNIVPGSVMTLRE